MKSFVLLAAVGLLASSAFARALSSTSDELPHSPSSSSALAKPVPTTSVVVEHKQTASDLPLAKPSELAKPVVSVEEPLKGRDDQRLAPVVTASAPASAPSHDTPLSEKKRDDAPAAIKASEEHQQQQQQQQQSQSQKHDIEDQKSEQQLQQPEKLDESIKGQKPIVEQPIKAPTLPTKTEAPLKLPQQQQQQHQLSYEQQQNDDKFEQQSQLEELPAQQEEIQQPIIQSEIKGQKFEEPTKTREPSTKSRLPSKLNETKGGAPIVADEEQAEVKGVKRQPPAIVTNEQYQHPLLALKRKLLGKHRGLFDTSAYSDDLQSINRWPNYQTYSSSPYYQQQPVQQQQQQIAGYKGQQPEYYRDSYQYQQQARGYQGSYDWFERPSYMSRFFNLFRPNVGYGGSEVQYASQPYSQSAGAYRSYY